MLLNADLTVRTLVHGGKVDWVPSPAKGVERRMLFRIGEEKAKATSIVRYAPQSSFPTHSHPGGEEFLVLEGVFQDETGDFPAGTYVRNPPGTAHAPASEGGCTIFVKLLQFREDDRARVVRRPGEGERGEPRAGVQSSTVLFESPHERVCLEEWQSNAQIAMSNPGGLELLVLAGSFSEQEEEFVRLSWLRLPARMTLRAHAGPQGARVWYKALP